MGAAAAAAGTGKQGWDSSGAATCPFCSRGSLETLRTQWGQGMGQSHPGAGTAPALQGTDGTGTIPRIPRLWGFWEQLQQGSPPLSARRKCPSKSSGWDGMGFPGETATHSQQINHELSPASGWDKTQGTEGEKNLNLPEITMNKQESSRGSLLCIRVVLNPDLYP